MNHLSLPHKFYNETPTDEQIKEKTNVEFVSEIDLVDNIVVWKGMKARCTRTIKQREELFVHYCMTDLMTLKEMSGKGGVFAFNGQTPS